MPWINIFMPNSITGETQEKIKSELAKILFDVLGKEERGVYITFSKVEGFYRAGKPCTDGAILDIRYIGDFGLDKKKEITKRICDLLADELDIDPEKVIVPFSELQSEN